MINRRLTWTLEHLSLLNNWQCGFRKKRSTIDHLARLEAEILNAFANKQHAIGIFFDIHKAFDTAWRFYILNQLHQWGYRGNMPILIQEFLKERYFQVAVGNTLSKERTMKSGVPQGSILSTNRFLIAVNEITKCLTNNVKGFLFVDDFAIICRSQSLAYIKRQLQAVTLRLIEWSKKTGFCFPPKKRSA